MLFLACAICLAAAVTLSLRPTLQPGLATQGRIELAGFDGTGVIVAFTAFTGIAWLFGLGVGAAALVALFIYELGQALAQRMLGAPTTHLRLLPVPFAPRGAGAEAGDDPLADCYVALMGGAVSLAPMLLAFAAAQLLAPIDNTIATWALTLAVTIGAVNAFMLLPFTPLDGGRVVRAFSDTFWPALGPALTCFMVAAFASAAARGGSLAFLVLAGIGLQSLLPRRHKVQRPLSPNNALTVLSAYSFTLAAHACAGWWIIRTLI